MKLLVNINHKYGRDSNVENVYFQFNNSKQSYTYKDDLSYELVFEKCMTGIIYDDNNKFIYATNYKI